MENLLWRNVLSSLSSTKHSCICTLPLLPSHGLCCGGLCLHERIPLAVLSSKNLGFLYVRCTFFSFVASVSFLNMFPEVRMLASRPASDLENQGLPFIWPLPFNLSSMDGPTGSSLHSPGNQGTETCVRHYGSNWREGLYCHPYVCNMCTSLVLIWLALLWDLRFWCHLRCKLWSSVVRHWIVW